MNKRWIYLITGTIGMLFAGIIYTWSILKVPLTEEFGWQGSSLAWTFTITMCMFCVGGIFGSVISKRLGVKLSVILGGVVCGLGFVLTSFLNDSQLGILYLTYGVMAGLGIGVAYNVLVSTVNSWFPDRRGLSSGCMMLGFGVSTLLLGTVSSFLFDSLGWRTTFLVLGAAIGVVLILAGLIIKQPEAVPQKTEEAEERGGTASGIRKESVNSEKTAAGIQVMDTDRNFTPKQMLSSGLFWKLFCILVFLSAIGSSIASFAKDLTIVSGGSDNFATTMVGIFAVCNGVFRVIIGILFDKIGRRKAMLLCSGMAVLTSAVCILTALTGSLVLCVCALCLAGCTLGCSPTIGAVGANTFFGEKYYPTNYSIITCNLLVASFMATLCSSLLTSTGGYLVPFIIFLVISVIGLILNLTIREG